jgi:hypothetical protein
MILQIIVGCVRASDLTHPAALMFFVVFKISCPVQLSLFDPLCNGHFQAIKRRGK